MQQETKPKRIFYKPSIPVSHKIQLQSTQIIYVKFINNHQFLCFGKNDPFVLYEKEKNYWREQDPITESQEIYCCTYNQVNESFIYAHRKGQIEELKFDKKKKQWNHQTIINSEGNQILNLQLNNNCNKIIECLHDFAVILEYNNGKWEEIMSLNENFEQDQCVFSTCACFNKDSTEIAVGFTDGHVAIWKYNNQSWNLAQTLDQQLESITALQFGKSKDILAIADKNGKLVTVQKQVNGEYIKQWEYKNNGVSINSVYFNNNSNIMLTAEGKLGKIWKQLNNNWIEMQVFNQLYDVISFDMSDDNKYLCIGLDQGFIKIYEYQDE